VVAYFERTGPTSFCATEHVSGAWEVSEQHIAPSLGLIAHCIERDRDARRNDGLVIGRLSYDILGTVPVADVEVETRVLRPGRTIELAEATMTHAGRAIVVARAWLMATRDTSSVAASPLPGIPGPDQTPVWPASEVWPGGFIESVEVRRAQDEPGRAHFWVRTGLPLVDGEEVSPLARVAGLLDISNGMTVRHDPRQVAFPNVDLTAHFFADPDPDWIGFDTSVSFGASGIGVTTSVLHAPAGPIGVSAQFLTVRPLG